MCCTEVRLCVSKATVLIVAHTSLHLSPAHARACQIWPVSHLLGVVGVGAKITVLATTLQEVLAHVRFEQLKRMFLPYTRVWAR